ncbi:hypothetical protein G6F16_011255 [Rhizopus arrhizus]|nr:hypothetical protein G6F24_011083 [Rhizopus arrhizus]KAG0787128.1 hypothetical protein G6F21_008112 [Rhizopus arrhizus]KAG0789800.1 hypothetical protein G6F22_006599 [Rhizopus arrhizus]KAG0811517.1 hypothetical protein G6F20_007096 [Rhizopus arrhizus]KAG0823270.1 hypothetical protein G6F19_010942 [Rhizopus arrhizus]
MASSPQSSSPTFQWTTPPQQEISIKEILNKYESNPELLKHVLMAKSEEDKKQTAQIVLRTEEVRIHLRQLDLQLAREQTHQRSSYSPPYLIPVQQQAFARIALPEDHDHYYPHSAHPLSHPYFQPTTPISPTEKKRSRASFSENEDKLVPHNKIMKTLKTRVQHTPSSLSESDKQQRTLPKLSPPPILPPIDPCIGRTFVNRDH